MKGETLLSFEVPGVPRPAKAQNIRITHKAGILDDPTTIRTALKKRDIYPIAYPPKDNEQTKAYIRQFAAQAMKEAGHTMLFAGPLVATYRFYFLLPKGRHFKKTESLSESSLLDKLFMGVTPDFDNLLKVTNDALNMVVFVDDKKIFRAIPEKLYTPNLPRTEISIRRPLFYECGVDMCQYLQERTEEDRFREMMSTNMEIVQG